MSGARPGLRLVGLPRPFERSAYAHASDEIEGLLGELPGLVAVYRLGSVGQPGISDLDRIAVVEAGDAVAPIWTQISPDARYLAMHGPFLVDLDTFRAHRWFSHLTGLQLARGEDVPVDEPADPAVCDLHLAAEGMTVMTLKLLVQARTGRVKVRPALCELHGLRLSLALAGLDARAAPVAWSFVEAVGAARQGWFAMPEAGRPAAMRALLAQAPAALVDGLLALEARLEERHALPLGERVALRAPWSSVTLVSSDAAAFPAACRGALRPGLRSAVAGRSRRLGALHWRLTHDRLPIAPRVAGLLTETRRGATALHRERHRVMTGYTRFLATRGQGYSNIGLGEAFT